VEDAPVQRQQQVPGGRRRIRLVLAAIVVAAAAAAVGQTIANLSQQRTSEPAALASSILPLGAGQGGPGPVLTNTGVAWVQVGGDIYRSADAGAYWRLVLAEPAGEAQTCGCAGGAYFLGAERAWVPVSDETPSFTFVVDRVLFTTDGGRTWRSSSPLPGLPPSSTVPLLGLSLSFVNDRVGYALASGSQADSKGGEPLTSLLWRTVDGGRSWRAVNSASLPLAGLLGDSGLIEQSPTRCGYDGELTVSFVSAAEGFISAGACTAEPPGLWQSIDGGRDWRPVPLVAPRGGWPGRGVPEAGLPVVTAGGTTSVGVTTDNGEVVVERRSQQGSFEVAGVLSTGELGRPAGPAILDSEHIVVPASDGLWRSDDGGKTWRLEVEPFDFAALAAMSFAPSASATGVSRRMGLVATAGADDASTGVLTSAPAGPLVLRSTDDGLHWQTAGRVAAPPGTATAYSEVDFADSRTGYLGGVDGVASSNDGGRSWRTEWSGGLPVISLVLDSAGLVALTSDEVLVRDSNGRWDAGTEPAAGALSSVALAAPGALYGAVCAREPYARSTGGDLVVSSDAGHSWRTVALPPRVGGCPEITTGQPAGGVEPQSPNQPLASLVCIATPHVLYAIGTVPVPRTFPYPLDGGFVPAELWRSDDGGRSWRPDGYAGASLVACTPAEVWSLTRIGPPGMGAETALFRTSGTATGRCLVERSPISLPASAGPCSSMVEEAGYWQSLVSMRSGNGALLGSCLDICDDPGHTELVATSDGRYWVGGPPVRGVGDGAVAASFLSPRTGFLLGPEMGRSASRVPIPPSSSSPTLLESTSDAGHSWRRLATFPQP
jgi:hypothetical protein